MPEMKSVLTKKVLDARVKSIQDLIDKLPMAETQLEAETLARLKTARNTLAHAREVLYPPERMGPAEVTEAEDVGVPADNSEEEAAAQAREDAKLAAHEEQEAASRAAMKRVHQQ